MTRTATISPASIASLMKGADALRQAYELLGNVELNDTRQGDLFAEGDAQACEAFMEERDELLHRNKDLEAACAAYQGRAERTETLLHQQLANDEAYKQGLRFEIDCLRDELVHVSNAYHQAQDDRNAAIDIANKNASDMATANAVLVHVADFAKQLQANLNGIGIYWRTDEETGEPRVSLNLALLEGAVRDMIDRS